MSLRDGQWVVKGFIDVYKHIYTISTDTKVVSKIIELYIFPLLFKFAQDNGLELELTKEQNFYPDITFIGNGTFAELGEDVFDDYWTNYLTPDMAKKAELISPYYNNLESYKKFRKIE